MTNFFAKNLKYLRNKKNIDQQIMAEDLGVAQSTLSCWENGLRTPDLDMIAKISKYLSIADDFITRDLTNSNNEQDFDELDVLWKRYKNILTEDDKETMKFLFEKRMREIDKQEGE